MTNIAEYIMTDMRKGVEDVMNDIRKHADFKYGNYGALYQILDELGFEELGDFDSNGWQWDFWAGWKKDGKKYTASGSGYYGGVSIALNEDDDDKEDDDE